MKFVSSSIFMFFCWLTSFIYVPSFLFCMREVDNVLRILRDTKSSIDRADFHELKFLSDQTIHEATISQDPDNIIVAVLVYALSKVFSRPNYRRMDGWSEFESSVSKNLVSSCKHLQSGEVDRARVHLGRIRNVLNRIDGDLGLYIKDVFRKAEINKAFKLYEHGLSSEQTAKLLGISLWDLASYIGQSSIHERTGSVGIPVQKRLEFAREAFS